MFREKKKMHIYMLKTVSFSLSWGEKNPPEISYFLGLKISLIESGRPFLKVLCMGIIQNASCLHLQIKV